MEHGIKISTPNAKLVGGAVPLPSDKYVFHLIHSRTLCMALSLPGVDLPVPVLFNRFKAESPSECSLHSDKDVALSLVRILLSRHPYVLSSLLVVGYQQRRETVVLYNHPLIRTQEFGISEVKPPCSLVVGPNPMSAEGTVPASTELPCCELVVASEFKTVWINEAANQQMEFSPQDTISVPSVLGVPSKPIIKQPHFLPVCKETATLHAQLFYAAGLGFPPISSCPASSFTTLAIMCKSHNSINLVSEVNIKPRQLLLLKHVLLTRMGLENCLQDFIQAYAESLAPVSDDQMAHFEKVLSMARERAEDIIFILNSVAAYSFTDSVCSSNNNSTLYKAMQKYFLMFPPTDQKNSVPFAVDIISIICKGVSFSKVVAFVQRYIPIQEKVGSTNQLKMFALLSI
ncbi:orf23 [Alcelaphine gammaherpesvirus 2]|uniref:Orf23 n=1 Tax=Alcelaphine gammaherpesvirus 2 TaxID=138184 RepID=A0A068AAK6_9GAMA|nr:orf23 [Alcelaphine gammaherpesvirus 2]AIA62060.1 orf23 [Alcelaphine gammaherpesvirus 2]